MKSFQAHTLHSFFFLRRTKIDVSSFIWSRWTFKNWKFQMETLKSIVEHIQKKDVSLTKLRGVNLWATFCIPVHPTSKVFEIQIWGCWLLIYSIWPVSMHKYNGNHHSPLLALIYIIPVCWSNSTYGGRMPESWCISLTIWSFCSIKTHPVGYNL